MHSDIECAAEISLSSISILVVPTCCRDLPGLPRLLSLGLFEVLVIQVKVLGRKNARAPESVEIPRDRGAASISPAVFARFRRA